MDNGNPVTASGRVSDVGQMWAEALTNVPGLLELPTQTAFRVAASDPTTVYIDGILAMSMAAGEVAILNTGDGDPASGKNTVTVSIASGTAPRVQVERTAFAPSYSTTGMFSAPRNTSFPSLTDPNLKAAAFHQNGSWVVVPGPASALYGQNYLNLTGALNSFATSPDSAAASVIGDLDLRIKLAPTTWTPATSGTLVSKYWSGGAQRSYLFQLSTAGTLVLWLSKDGLSGLGVASSVVVPASAGEVKWVRVTWQASNALTRFFWSNDGIVWTQLGTDLTHGYTGPLFDGTAVLGVGAKAQDNTELFTGKVFYADVRSGINGQIVAKFDPTTNASVGATSFVSGTGETWTLGSTATIQTGCPVSNSAANGFESTPFWPDSNGPLMAAKDITDATAPFVTAPDAQALLGSTYWNSDHTVYAMCNATALTAAPAAFVAHGLDATDGFFMQGTASTGAMNCTWHSSGAPQFVTKTITANAWLGSSVISASKNGSNYIARVNGSEASAAVTTIATNPVTRNLYFGRYTNVGRNLRGPLTCVFFYSTAHTSAQKANIEALLTGDAAVGTTGVVPITTTRSGAVRDLGAVEPENLLKWSVNPTLVPWGANGSTSVTPNVTGISAPDSTSQDVFQITATAAASFPGIYQQVGTGFTTLTFAVSILAGSVSKARVGIYDFTAAAMLTPTAASVLSGPGTIAGTTTQVVSGITSWTRVQLTVTGIDPTHAVGIYVYPGDGATLGVGLNAYFWGPRVSVSTLPLNTDYKTYADARPTGPVLYTAGDNARIPHPTKGLPCFAAVTNLCMWSQDLSNAAWTKAAAGTGTVPIVTANAGLAPDRTLTASRVQLVQGAGTTSSDYSRVFMGQTVSNATVYTQSIWIKTNDGTTKVIQWRDDFGGLGARLLTVTPNWQQFIMVGTSSSTTVNSFSLWVRGGQGTDTSADLLVWGAQLEQSAFAGPYVPTGATSVSSAMDISTISPNGWPVNGGEIELVYTPWSPPSGATRCLLSSFYGANQGLQLAITYSTQIDQLNLVLVDGTGNTQTKSSTLTWVAGQAYTIKAKWLNGNAFIYRDGVLVASDTSGTAKIPASHNNPAYIGSRNATLDPANGHIRILYIGKPRS